MRPILILPLLLAACSSAGDADRSPERNVAATEGSAPEPVPSVSPAVDGLAPPADAAPAANASAGSAAGIGAAALAEGPEQGPAAAADVVRRYYSLIGRGEAAAAWGLWDNGGRASGMGRAAFARSFARYARLDADVGEAGRIEAGAGQRHVTVPVALSGKLKTGEAVAMQGTVLLHRAGPIDGATAEQRRWRIARVDIKPRPAESATPSASPTPSTTPSAAAADAPVARYRCTDGSLMLVRFDRARDTADVELGGELLGLLDGQRPASGIWYKRGETELRGKGDEATLTRASASELRCTVQH